MLTLAIDTSTNILSVALVSGDEVLAFINEQTKNNQSEILMSRIESMVIKCNLKPTDLEKIAVAIGPGSYTGIRVGVAAAKSLAYVLNIPVVAISSLKVMAMSVSGMADMIVAMIDARRKTVFAGVYDANGENIIPDGHYDINAFLEGLPKGESMYFVADDVLASKETWHTSEVQVKRSKAIVLAEISLKTNAIDNVHNLKPSYLRKTEAELSAGV